MIDEFKDTSHYESSRKKLKQVEKLINLPLVSAVIFLFIFIGGVRGGRRHRFNLHHTQLFSTEQTVILFLVTCLFIVLALFISMQFKPFPIISEIYLIVVVFAYDSALSRLLCLVEMVIVGIAFYAMLEYKKLSELEGFPSFITINTKVEFDNSTTARALANCATRSKLKTVAYVKDENNNSKQKRVEYESEFTNTEFNDALNDYNSESSYNYQHNELINLGNEVLDTENKTLEHMEVFSKPADHIFSEEVRAKAKIKREAREKELKAQWEMEAAQKIEQADISDINKLKQANIYTGDIEFWDKFDENK